MDNLYRILILLLISTKVDAGNWLPGGYIDGPAPATYERTPDKLKVYVDMPKSGGHTYYTLESNPLNSKGGDYISPKSTGTSGNVSPKIATSVKIPYGNAAGSAVTAVLSSPILKSGMAKAGLALVRANPYLSTLITFGWLANAGYQYLTSGDTFAEQLPATTSTLYNYNGGSTITQDWQSAAIARGDLIRQQNHCASGSYTGYCPNPANVYLTSETSTSFVFGFSSTVYTLISGNKTATTNCPTNYTYSSGTICNRNSNAPLTPKTDAQVIDKLSTTPITGTVDTPTTVDDELGELVKHDYIPEKDPSKANELRGPNGETSISKQGDTSTTTYPDGSVALRRLDYQTQFADDRAEIVEMLTEQTTPASGPTTTTTTSRPPAYTPSVSQSTTEASTTTEQQTDCDKYPNSIGCSQYGTPETPTALTETQGPSTISYTSWGSGSCPASVALPYGITWDYTFYCESLVKMRPVVVGAALLLSLFIVAAGVKE